MMDLDLDHLRTWIGREEIKSEPVTPALVERFNATFGRTGDTTTGTPAPVMIHFCLAPPAAPAGELGPDGHPLRGGFLPPVPLPRRMWAGGSFAFHDDIRIGETVTRRSTIRDVAVKQGRTGTLCFVTVEHRIESDSRHVLTERQDIVYRDLDPASGPSKAPPPPAPEGAHRVTVEPTAPLLFRYSALTFNGHRIHYDAPYTREVEGYPGLIVHGPLQASQLVHLAERVRGRVPRTFDFRSLSTIFDTADYTLNATEDGDALKLWTAQAGGPIAMQARATW